jgi:hypothetical protein
MQLIPQPFGERLQCFLILCWVGEQEQAELLISAISFSGLPLVHWIWPEGYMN